MTKDQKTKFLLLKAADYLETAADIIADGIDDDEDDNADALQLVKDLREHAEKL